MWEYNNVYRTTHTQPVKISHDFSSKVRVFPSEVLNIGEIKHASCDVVQPSTSLFSTSHNLSNHNEGMKTIKRKLFDKCYLILVSEEPEATNLPMYCKQAMPLLCPLNVRTNSHVAVV